MKKHYLILFLFVVLIAAGCGNKNNKNKARNTNPEINQEQQNQDDNPDANCFSICHNKIQDVCLEEIIEFGPEELAASGSLMDPASCEATCAANFNDFTLDCFTKITKCDQVGSGDPWCKESEIPDSEVYDIDESETRSGCQIPCEKYKKCAGYGDDATAQDMAEAYTSCMEVCQGWSDSTINCINQKTITSAADCMHLSNCALNEYRGMLK